MDSSSTTTPAPACTAQRRLDFGHYPELVAMGVCVAIGADGAANNNTLDMFREMRLAATAHKEARMDSTAIPARTAFDMATVNGATVCRWPDVGRLRVGMKAT